MELLSNLFYGFTVALSLQNLYYCFLGCFVGTLIGVLPGVGPLATLSLLMPITFTISPVSGLIMLAGIYYGAMYGGSTTSILVNLPGETSAVVTCIDGYQMARQGRAGPALAIAAIASFFAGCVSTMVIAVFGPLIAKLALKFTSPEYFSLMLMGLVSAAVLAEGNMIKSLAMVLMGLLLGCVGTDLNSGWHRFTFDFMELADGFHFAVIAVGIFAVTEIIENIGNPEQKEVFTSSVSHLYPTKRDMKQSILPIVRGTLLGGFFGTLPGTGASISAFSSYMLEKKLAKDPSRFGRGAIEGVAGPEASNNAAAQCAYIPTLTLGIPGSANMALMLGAIIVHGISPGPTIMTKQPDLFWGLIVSMWIGNLVLLILNLPLVGLWVRVLKIPYRYLFPAIMVFSGIGIYSLSNAPFELYLVAIFSVVGFIWRKLGCPPAPMMLGLVLGPMLEENLRRSLLVSRGDPMIFMERPISLAFIIITVLILIVMSLPTIKKRRKGITR